MEPDPAVRVVAMAWYRRADYPRILEIMEDADELFRVYGNWLRSAEKAERRVRKAGLSVVRVMIEPDAFIAYCARNDLKLIGSTRAQYARDVPTSQSDATE